MTASADLDALIEELTVDAYGDEEQLSARLVGAVEALVAGPARAALMCQANGTIKTCAQPLTRQAGW